MGEFFLARTFKGWTLEYIRSLSPADYKIMLEMSMLYEQLMRVEDLKITSASMGMRIK
jgi:hypothetical protein